MTVMPFVVNGIGTWYYGKRRIHTLNGTCEFCGRQTELESFDTTLYVVVIFVPVIPLGQKRILQECSVCRRHRVLSLAKWQQAKARDVAELLEKFRRDPEDHDTPTPAIGLPVPYQAEPLFNEVVETFPAGCSRDAAI